jgi:hypothetical protein
MRKSLFLRYMKKSLLFVAILFTISSLAQSDSTSRNSYFNATLKLGSFSGQSSPTQKIQGFAYNPYLCFGNKIKLNLGFLIVSLDTNGQGIDTLNTELSNFEVGLSFEEFVGKTNIYIGGGFNLLGNNKSENFNGNRVMINMGYLIDKTFDLSVQASRTFNRNPGISGSLLMFGLGIRF